MKAILAFRTDLRVDSTRVAACALDAQVQDTAAVRWVLPAARRRGFVTGHGPAAGLSFEADFQWLDGGEYRRFEHYEVRPRSADGRVWRVVRYELQGEEFIDDFGAAARRP